MPPLPVLNGQEVVRVFESFGWTVARQRSSHIIMTKEGENVTLSIPNHKEVARGHAQESHPLRKPHARRIHQSDLTHAPPA